MSVEVTLQRGGTLEIRSGGHLVTTLPGAFVDVDYDESRVVAVKATGRVQEFDVAGRFKRDILGSGGVSVQIAGDVLKIGKTNGRTEEYRDGRIVRSY